MCLEASFTIELEKPKSAIAIISWTYYNSKCINNNALVIAANIVCRGKSMLAQAEIACSVRA